MIPRYSRPKMAEIWTDQHKYQTWLRVEMAVCEGLARISVIPNEEWQVLKQRVESLTERGGIDPKRVDHFEAQSRHDVIAFTTALAEEIGPVSRYVHFGLTSSDVVDTALSVQIQEAGNLLKEGVKNLLKTLKDLAEKYQRLPTIGRSHGIFAEPTSFGLKFLGWFCEWKRNQQRLNRALEDIRFGKLSGAVGVNPHWSPEFEEEVLGQLGLQREWVSTQVIPRDRHAEWVSTLSLLGSSLERIAIELRHLQRSEVGEVKEGFEKTQKGSSAMPHKRNPISSENITGCARLLRSYAQAAFEDIALWHERDLSHSSVERVILPDSTLLLDYALHRMNGILANLTVHEDQIRAHVERAGSAVFSGHFLLELVQQGVVREKAYAWIQECALASFDQKKDFVSLIAEHPEISQKLTQKRIREIGSVSYQLRNVSEIYDQVSQTFKEGF